jgi:hypothetical protein
MINIPLAKSSLEKILKPINRLTESCILNVSQEHIYSICSSTDNTVILFAKINRPQNNCGENKFRLNLINIKKLLSGLECLGDDGVFSIQYSSNNIICEMLDEETEEKTHFKYHLVDDSVIKESTININKIASLKFDTEFLISSNKLKQIVSGYTFASDVSKLYISTKEGKVRAEIDDKTLQNVDNISFLISKEYTGEDIEDPIPLNLEVFKNLVHSRNDVKVKFNTQYKVFVFQNTEDEEVELKYIISALVK